MWTIRVPCRTRGIALAIALPIALAVALPIALAVALAIALAIALAVALPISTHNVRAEALSAALQ